MATTKRIVCLANSRKLSGRCVAGVELTAEGPPKWIRPVSARENQEVSEYERQYENGSDPKLLDIIDVSLLGHQPSGFQQENWLLDPERYWVKVGVFAWHDLHKFSEQPHKQAAESTDSGAGISGSPEVDAKGLSLWQNGCSSSNGTNDRIPDQAAATETSSLKLIHVNTLRLHIFAPSAAFGNSEQRVQGRFEFAGEQYALWVTDPHIERRYLAKDDGEYELEECYLTISLGEPFKGYCYKLIAAVLEKPG